MQHLCQILHSFAKWRIEPRKLTPLLDEQLLQRYSAFDLHKSSVALWSLAMLSFRRNEAVQALTDRAEALLDLKAYQQGDTFPVCSAYWTN